MNDESLTLDSQACWVQPQVLLPFWFLLPLLATTTFTWAVLRFCSWLVGLLLLISSQGHCKSEFITLHKDYKHYYYL